VQGNSSTLTWSSANATSCIGTNFNTGGATSGHVIVSPSSTTNYTVQCTNSYGDNVTATATVTVTSSADVTATLTAAESNTSAVATQPATLAATVSNISSTATGVQFPTTFWINSSPTQSGASYTEFTSGVPNGLGSNSNETDSISHTFSSTGTYYYQVCADDDQSGNHAFSESNYANNCSSWGTITVSPPIPPNQPGNQTAVCNANSTAVTLSWTAPAYATSYYPRIISYPTFSTPGNCTSYGWSVYTDNQTCYPDPEFPSGIPGTSVASFPVTPGVTYLWDVSPADSTGVNWTGTVNHFSCAAPLPDLTSAASAPVSATQGQAVSLLGTVSNIGAGSAGSFPNIVQICTTSDCSNLVTNIAANTISSLAAGANAPTTASYTPTTAGTYYYRTCANENTSGTQIIAESNPNNDCSASATLTVTAPLSASCTATPSSAVAPANITWTAVASGGVAPYTYSWSGNVSGTSNPTVQSYPSPGTYSGTVTVTDSTGAQQTTACSNDPVTVISCTPTLTASPTTITQGNSSTLSWSENTSCAASCTGTGFATGGALSGNTPVYPPTTSSYSLSCGPYTATPQTVMVLVPSVTLTASPSRVVSGGTTSLTWNSNLTTSCVVSRNGGAVISASATSGSNVPDPTPITEQTVYTATCQTAGNPVSATAIVNLKPAFSEF
jgi:hypothetical protein